VNEIDTTMMESVYQSIQTAISGFSTVKGGAHIYDQGSPEQCFRLYYLTSACLLQHAKALYGNSAPKYFWVLILEKVLVDSRPGLQLNQMSTTGGSVDEGAWALRRAFEAIKFGFSLRDKKYKSHALTASRFNSSEYMEIAQAKSLLPAL